MSTAYLVPIIIYPTEIIKEAVLKYEMVKNDDFKEEVKNEKKEACTQTLKKEVKEDHLHVDRLVKKDDFKEMVKDEKKEVRTRTLKKEVKENHLSIHRKSEKVIDFEEVMDFSKSVSTSEN